MKNAVTHLSMWSAIVRLTIITLMAAIVGGVVGFTSVNAETIWSYYVDGYGNVLTKSTTGATCCTTPVTTYGTGHSSTSVSVYYLKAHARIWHWMALNM